MSDRIPILQTPRALSATEKRVFDKLRSGDAPERICKDLHIWPEIYHGIVQSIRSKGHNPDEKEVVKEMKWTSEDEKVLINMNQQEIPMRDIAEKLGRTTAQCRTRLSLIRRRPSVNQQSASPAPASKMEITQSSAALAEFKTIDEIARQHSVPADRKPNEPDQTDKLVPDVVMQALIDARDRLRFQLETHRRMSRNIEQDLQQIDDYIGNLQGA